MQGELDVEVTQIDEQDALHGPSAANKLHSKHTPSHKAAAGGNAYLVLAHAGECSSPLVDRSAGC